MSKKLLSKFGGPTVQSITTKNSNGKNSTGYYAGHKTQKEYMNYMTKGMQEEREALRKEALRKETLRKETNPSVSLFTEIDYVENVTSKSVLNMLESTTIQSLDEYDTQIYSDEFYQVYPLLETLKLPSKEEYGQMALSNPLDKQLEKLTFILYMIRKRMNQKIGGKATRIHPEAKVLPIKSYYNAYGTISENIEGNTFDMIMASANERQLENLDRLLKMLLPYPNIEPPKKSFFNRLKNTLKFKG